MPRNSNANGDIADVNAQPLTPFQHLLQVMDMEATAETDSQAAGNDLNVLLSAETDEEAWDADERPPLNFQHLADCDLEIRSIDVKYSRGVNSDIQSIFVSPDGRQMYLMVECVRITNAGQKTIINLPKVGEVFQANTSAKYLVGKFMNFYLRGRVPFRTHIKSVPLDGGQQVLKARPFEGEPIQSYAE
jgi:hypothetical protein